MSATETLAARLEPMGELRRSEVLARHTTFGIGGPADLFLTVRSAEALARATNAAHDAGVPVFVLGSGSNILVADAGIRGLVLDNRARAEAHDDLVIRRLQQIRKDRRVVFWLVRLQQDDIYVNGDRRQHLGRCVTAWRQCHDQAVLRP